MNRHWCFGLCAVLLAGAAFAVLVTASAQTREETEAKLRRAMTGGPYEIAKNARSSSSPPPGV